MAPAFLLSSCPESTHSHTTTTRDTPAWEWGDCHDKQQQQIQPKKIAINRETQHLGIGLSLNQIISARKFCVLDQGCPGLMCWYLSVRGQTELPWASPPTGLGGQCRRPGSPNDHDESCWLSTPEHFIITSFLFPWLDRCRGLLTKLLINFLCSVVLSF